ncbi:MAG: hypothetical protein U5R30_14870 [Deltaproteobacteria bacterium]|nr:hypothetical protein [Deltaproteobacteria bacterium]
MGQRFVEASARVLAGCPESRRHVCERDTPSAGYILRNIATRCCRRH